ncbi:MAG: aminomethyl-transferring glycine dehydrogenase subunit GcvPB [Candidatus Lokiarchaeota archaeon]|nr:aminomethyl-transferring glycine dehydrogenase subunit GcvPB [Candidatus Lokiarchaeota archaeon]
MDIDETLIFNKGNELVQQNFIPTLDIKSERIEDILPKNLIRDELRIPDVSEVEIVRHYVKLSKMNYGVDSGIYPLGSCTMKYNPKINEIVARMPNFSQLHPLQEENEGVLEILYEISKMLGEITGMDGFTLQPAAGAHGELVGLLIIKKYFETKGMVKNKIIVPDSAHGTNPASAKMAGFSIIELKSNEHGEVPLDHLEYAMKQGDVAGIMLTNPNTLGVFDRQIKDITKIVHEYGGLCYYDGANLNPMLGICRPKDMGFDIVHLNLHKTFSTPHGGGGPGSGPVGVTNELIPFLPVPCIVSTDNGIVCNYENYESVGRIKAFWGNFGIVLRAYVYILSLGANGLKRVGQIAVLNANYLKTLLKKKYDLPYKRICQHEFVLSDKNLPNNVNTEDIAKRILDYGYYAPTIYFPLVVNGALMVEPTETESKNSLDKFVEVMYRIYDEALNEPEKLKNAPSNTPVGRLDAVNAARKPVLHD